jgi:hypothetical protein
VVCVRLLRRIIAGMRPSVLTNRLGSAARIACVLLLLLMCLSHVAARHSSAKPSSNNRRYSTYVGDREFRQRKVDCSSSECAGKTGADELNCTYKCMSPTCFAEIYGHDEIEEGEIDSSRSRLFNTCFKRFMKEEEIGKSAARAGAAAQVAPRS